MNVDIYGSVWCIGLSYPLSKTDLSFEVDRFESTISINLRLMFSNEINSKRAKINNRLY